MALNQRFHLLKDLWVYKQTIKKNYYYGDLHSEYPEVAKLLDRRTQRYTLTEIEELFGFLWTSHDDCVDENADDYSPLQVYQARAKIKAGQEAFKRLEKLKALNSRSCPIMTERE